MQKYALLFFSVLVLNFSTNGQSRADYRRKFTEGSFLILENNYTQALKSFLEAYEIDSTNANINYKIGFCYLKTVADKLKGLPYLEKAVAKTSKKYLDMEPSEKSAPVNAYYYYGQALHVNYKFDEAIANYEKFKSFLNPKQEDLLKDVDRQIEISNNAKLLVSAPINVIIKNLGDSVNSPYPDYSPLVSADEKTLIFTSRRPGSTGGDKTDNGSFYEDIYISRKINDTTWSSPVSISSNINTITNDASVGLSADAQTLLIYKDSNGGDIYSSTLKGEEWTIPEAMSSGINSSSWETSACISPDGTVLYFVSDRKGGLGGRDIWKCVRLPKGNWSQPVNLGAPINTPYDEESPFIHPSGNVLFFSSQGHQSMGGFDIFFSTKGEKGWDEPINIGYPINTTDDDLYYVTSPDGKRGYYSSSSRPEGYGEKDIYLITIPERKEEPLVLIKGRIIPAQGDPLPTRLEIIATNNETGIVSGTYTPLVRDGSFTIIIPPNSNYNFSYQNDGQEFFNENVEMPADAVYKEVSKILYLKHTGSGKPLEIEMNPQETQAKDSVSKTDKSALVSITGKVIDDKNEPVTNSKVNLINSKGETIKTTTVDNSGQFEYKALPQNENYIVALAEEDTHTIGKKSSLLLKDEKGKAFKSKTTSVAFKSVNKKQVVKESSATITVTKEKHEQLAKVNTTVPNEKHEQLAKVDNQNFQMLFKYNVTEIDINDAPFKQFVDNLMGIYNKNGSVNIKINSSASQVPTRAFKSNKELAIVRAENAKQQLLNALKDKGADISKVNFVKVKSLVAGPQYNSDYLINNSLYEKYQFIKISAN